MKTLERTVEEIVEEIAEIIDLCDKGDHDKCDKKREWFTNLLQAERQKREEAVEVERERCKKIVEDENYILEEWYATSLRPQMIDVFHANQRNIKTRNAITSAITQPSNK